MKANTVLVLAGVAALAVVAVVLVRQSQPVIAPAAPPVLPPVPAGAKPSTTDKILGVITGGLAVFGQGRSGGLW